MQVYCCKTAQMYFFLDKTTMSTKTLFLFKTVNLGASKNISFDHYVNVLKRNRKKASSKTSRSGDSCFLAQLSSFDLVGKQYSTQVLP